MKLQSSSSPLLTLIVASLAAIQVVARGSAASQYHLDVNSDISRCWLQCHALTIALVHNTDEDPLGNEQAIGGNCDDEPYLESIPNCLINACGSAPDVAYAWEFGVRWCEKAGFDIRDRMKLPVEYTENRAGEYFESEAYLSSASQVVGEKHNALIAGAALAASLVAAFAQF